MILQWTEIDGEWHAEAVPTITCAQHGHDYPEAAGSCPLCRQEALPHRVFMESPEEFLPLTRRQSLFIFGTLALACLPWIWGLVRVWR